MAVVLALLGAGLVAALSSNASAAPVHRSCDWPMYQHDAAHHAASGCDGISQTNVSTLRPAWFAATAGPVTAEPIVADHRVYVGDATGIFRALDQATGKTTWTFDVLHNRLHVDRHAAPYGTITSTAATAVVGGVRTVFFAGGGSLYALRAADPSKGWARDIDPAEPSSRMEIESSPVVDLSTTPPEVIVGDDANQASGVGQAGVMAFNAQTGALLWKYEPETGHVVTPANSGGTTASALSAGDGHGNGCGDVWSSPALDPTFGAHGLVVFGVGDCPTSAVLESVVALDPVTGHQVWRFVEPRNRYDYTTASIDNDDDFGSSPIITGGLVVEGGKSGYVYGLHEATGTQAWPAVLAAEPGQLSPQIVGAVGGFIGSASLGRAGGHPAVFLQSAIETPLSGTGVDLTPPPYPPCLGNLTVLPACPDASLASDPLRSVSLHAVDITTGRVIWHAPLTTPSYAATSYANGVVFAGSTLQFTAAAYSADTGAPLWRFPLLASPSSGTSIVGSSVFLGAGTSDGNVQGVVLPPQAFGVWSFSTTVAGGAV